jgi:hypothetical protein
MSLDGDSPGAEVGPYVITLVARLVQGCEIVTSARYECDLPQARVLLSRIKMYTGTWVVMKRAGGVMQLIASDSCDLAAVAQMECGRRSECKFVSYNAAGRQVILIFQGSSASVRYR